MTDSAAILELRHCRVAEQATLSSAALSDDEQGVFVAIDDPPPVRTVLTAVQGEQRRALEVAWVVEVAERDERRTRGFYGRWVDDEALSRAGKVGTEHLDDGTPVVQPVMPEHSVHIDVSDAPPLAMPAPVMIIEDDTGVIEVGDTGPSEDADEPGEPGEPGDAEAVSADAVSAEASETATHSADPEAVAAQEGQADEQASEGADQAVAAESSEEEAPAGETGDAEDAEDAEDDASVTAQADDAPETETTTAEAEDGTKNSSGGKRRGGRKKRGRKRR